MENYNLIFVANFALTKTLLEISNLLPDNFSVHWIVFSKFDLSILQEASLIGDKILFLPTNVSSSEKSNVVNDIPLNELIYSDRVMRFSPHSGKHYLRHVEKNVRRFCAEKNIKFVFGESTWAHERIIGRLVSQLGIRYFTPHSIRFPAGRFCFFQGELQDVIYERIDDEKPSGLISLPEWESPIYLHLNDKIIADKGRAISKLKRLWNFISAKNIDFNSPFYLVNFLHRLHLGISEELNRLSYRHLVRRLYLDELLERNYYVYALHKQPESSIDVMGRYYEDQFINIVNLQRALPDGYILLVKEHSNAIGDRSLLFYRKIHRLQDVYIVHENSNTRELILNATGVFTVSGTIAFEAAYMGIQSFTFVPMFFNIMPRCSFITLDTLRQIKTLLDLKEAGYEESNLSGLNTIYCNSFEGVFTDPITMPSVLDNTNLEKLSDAFQKVMKSC